MKRKTLDKDLILETYNKNKDKGKYWVADYLGLNRSSVSTLINKYECNNKPLDKTLELKILKLIKQFPYTGTLKKIYNTLRISKHPVEQVIHKTQNQKIKLHFQTPKHSSHNLTDQDIQDILDGSKLGIGNDLMGIKKGIDGVCIRNIRKKFLTKEEYEKYHSISRFYEGDYNSYYNERGDKFLSSWEEKVADYLFLNKIKYFSNIRIKHKTKNYSPDFLLFDSNAFIEVLGMSNVNCYKGRMNEKIQFYKDNKIKCLLLYEEEFLTNKKVNDKYKFAIDCFLKEIKNQKYNEHVENIYVNYKNFTK